MARVVLILRGLYGEGGLNFEVFMARVVLISRGLYGEGGLNFERSL